MLYYFLLFKRYGKLTKDPSVFSAPIPGITAPPDTRVSAIYRETACQQLWHAALQAGSGAVEAAKPDEKKESAPETRPAANGDGDEKPEGRLLPWEPAAPAESNETTDK